VGRARKIIDRVPVNVWIAESMIADLDAYAAELQRATTRRISRSDALRLIVGQFFDMRRPAATETTERDTACPSSKGRLGRQSSATGAQPL
jgi:hypothetical protein